MRRKAVNETTVLIAAFYRNPNASARNAKSATWKIRLRYVN
jgi:hypothetical protein